MKRQAQHCNKKKNCPIVAAWTRECSWRASIAPAGWTSSGLRAPHKRRMGRRTRWHLSCSHCRKKKKPFSRVIPVLGAMLTFQYRSTGDARIVRVILTPEPCHFHRIRRVDAIVVKKLQQRVAQFVLLHQSPPRIMRVILAHGSCQVLQILDVSSKQGPCYSSSTLLFKKNSMYVSSLHKGPCKISLCKKKSANASMWKRKSSFQRRIPNTLRSAFP